jgi:hypothetical protein
MDSIMYEDLRTTEYKGFTLTMKDPYGFVSVKGLPGQYTSFTMAQKYIDSHLAAKDIIKTAPTTKKSPKL